MLPKKFSFNWLQVNWLRVLIILIIIMGIFWRVSNLGRRFYWYDEVFTSLRISGYTTVEFVEYVSNSRVISLEELQKFQRPNSEKTALDTITSLAREEPQHPPFYFLIARFWLQYFGFSVPTIRSLSALISLLVFPCVYWLCCELFASPFTGWIAVAIIAVSPFHLLYAGEARQYSLWMLLSVVSSLALLRSLRLKNKTSWAFYTLTVILGLYTFPFFMLSVIGYGVYVLGRDRYKFSPTFKAYLLSSLFGILAFTPWIITLLKRLPERTHDPNTSWMFEPLSLPSLVVRWIGGITRLFLDWGFRSEDPPTPALILVLPILLLVGYSIYFICKRSPLEVWLFVITLIFVPTLALIGHDLILQGRISVISRYYTPVFLGLQLAVAYLLSTQLTADCLKKWQQTFWQITLLFVLSSGVFSCVIISQSRIWFHQSQIIQRAYIPETINKFVNISPRPLIIADIGDDFAVGSLLSLSYEVDTHVKFFFVNYPKKFQIPENFSNIFVFSPSQELQNILETNHHYKIYPIHATPREEGVLWELKKEE